MDRHALHLRDFLKHGVAAAAFPALSFEELRHLGAAMNDARRYLDADVVQYFKRQLELTTVPTARRRRCQ